MPAQVTIPSKLSITIYRENKIFNDKARFSQYVSTNPALQKALEGKLHSKKVYYAHKDLGNR